VCGNWSRLTSVLRVVLTSISLRERFCYFLLVVDFAFSRLVSWSLFLPWQLLCDHRLNIFVLQMVQNPDRACWPFFIITCCSSFIFRFSLHFTYVCGQLDINPVLEYKNNIFLAFHGTKSNEMDTLSKFFVPVIRIHLRVPTQLRKELSHGVNNFQYIFMLWHTPINSWIDIQDWAL
jgi:hypothetical protein